MMTREPDITINGVKLTVAQSMTVRVALCGMDWDCGTDAFGKRMAENYRARTQEIFDIMTGRAHERDQPPR